MNKKNNQSSSFLPYLAIFFLLVTLVLIVWYLIQENNDRVLDEEFEKNGYTTLDFDDAFYNNIVSNNTLDDYYNDKENEKDTIYEEYYISKESNDFIELKMIYEKGIEKTLNIISDLNTFNIEYNYEIVYQKSHILLDGNTTNNYQCKNKKLQIITARKQKMK